MSKLKTNKALAAFLCHHIANSIPSENIIECSFYMASLKSDGQMHYENIRKNNYNGFRKRHFLLIFFFYSLFMLWI